MYMVQLICMIQKNFLNENITLISQKNMLKEW